jgi:Leucine-rich repeat (LRR) protein
VLKSVFTYSFFIFSLIILSGFSQTKSAEEYYKEGVQKIKSKEYLGAIGDFTAAISLKKDYADAYLERANAKMLFAESKGFENLEYCSDLINAANFGSNNAKLLMHNNCTKQCMSIEMAFFEPELVFCADFSNKVLYDMPKGSNHLLNLVKLNLFNNKMVNIPPVLGKLTALTYLDFSSNRLVTLDNTICKLTFLRDLNLGKNQITTISENIGELKDLTHLYLQNNEIKTIPKTIGKLEHLEILDLSHNHIENLPQEIINCKKLKTLILVGNDFSAKEQNKIKSLLPGANVYF